MATSNRLETSTSTPEKSHSRHITNHQRMSPGIRNPSRTDIARCPRLFGQLNVGQKCTQRDNSIGGDSITVTSARAAACISAPTGHTQRVRHWFACAPLGVGGCRTGLNELMHGRNRLLLWTVRRVSVKCYCANGRTTSCQRTHVTSFCYIVANSE